ncbi:RNA ligase [Tenacibaculum phage pT24]|uniref:RNA ligase n=1 Tax=Tenacibaculum phage pT24 TaxID=1880590 RepID=A0A1W7GKR0_9CAUD|nr:RNA ligase and tail fiber protein attachment catalyst [Tenacibaculum phage pT24]BAX25564.1 RNA ligase [Tenacibaculum phage pT24]
MKVDLKLSGLALFQTLRNYEKRGLVISQRHPQNKEIIIWNYSKQTQYDNHWDEITLNARSLVTNTKGDIIARGFPKFFNYEEPEFELPDTKLYNIKYFKKLDGSLILLFNYEGRWYVSSRGSFESDQCNMAKSILRDKYNGYSNWLDKDLTYCLELIHPSNRVVVDYGDEEDLIMIGILTSNMQSVDMSKLTCGDFRYQKEELIPFDDFKLIQQQDTENEEGYVMLFPNGYRGKIKFENYKYLHYLYGEFSPLAIWKCLKEKDNDRLMFIKDNTPDEFYDEVKKCIFKLKKQFFQIKNTILSDLNDFLPDDYINDHELFKSLGKRLITAFNDEYKLDRMIWDDIKPKNNIFS